MIKIEDFKDGQGEIDWTAYRQAQVDSGEKCYKCGGYNFFGGKGSKSLCRGCNGFLIEGKEVEHRTDVRCPHCRTSWRFDWLEGGITDGVLWGDDPLSLVCPDCDKDFDVDVHVEVTFESPPLID